MESVVGHSLLGVIIDFTALKQIKVLSLHIMLLSSHLRACYFILIVVVLFNQLMISIRTVAGVK